MYENKLACCICGSDMAAEEGSEKFRCLSCGSTLKILPDSMKKLNRINYLRNTFSFKDAARLSVKLIEEFPNESMSYWSKFLCEYGIQYLKDSSGFVPVLRVDASVVPPVKENESYKSALSFADEEDKATYEKWGDLIQNSIEISKAVMSQGSEEEAQSSSTESAGAADEAPDYKFDVYVLSRENVTPDDDFDGDRIFLRFQENLGFNVFYAPELFKDQDEISKAAYIVYAIKNSRILLPSFRSKDDANDGFLNYVVKAFSSIAEKNEDKMIFPIFDSSNLSLQQLPVSLVWNDEIFDSSQDEFMRELSDRIEKIVKPAEASIAPEAIVTVTAANKENLIKRAYMFLEDGDFETADTYFDKILDIDVEESRAYIGKLLAQCRIRSEDEIPNLPQTVTDDKNFKKALRFATPEQKKRYESLNGAIVNRIESEKKRISEERQRITAEREALEEAERVRRERQNKEERRMEYKRRQEPLRNTLQQIQAELAKSALVVNGKKRKELQEQEETVKKNLKNLDMMFADIFD